MIQRSLLRPVQAIRHLPRPYASRATPIARGATQRLPAISSHHGLSSQRYYSAAAEPATNPSSEPPNTSSASSEAQEQQDPAKKELDSKNREIIDLKVRLSYCAPMVKLILFFQLLGPLLTLCRRFPQPPRPNKARHPIGPRLRHAKIRRRSH